MKKSTQLLLWGLVIAAFVLAFIPQAEDAFRWAVLVALITVLYHAKGIIPLDKR